MFVRLLRINIEICQLEFLRKFYNKSKKGNKSKDVRSSSSSAIVSNSTNFI